MYPRISEDRFQQFEWEDFYRDAEEAIPADAPKPQGKVMTTHWFVNASQSSDKVTRRYQTGKLIFCNRAPIMWFSKRKNSVETSTFRSEFTMLKQAAKMVKALRHKLRFRSTNQGTYGHVLWQRVGIQELFNTGVSTTQEAPKHFLPYVLRISRSRNMPHLQERYRD